MIYFRNNGEIREKYELTYDISKLNELKMKIIFNCGELSIVKKECKYGSIPTEGSLRHGPDNSYHYMMDVHYKESKKKAKEWDHYEVYEVNLFYCDYKDYMCPDLVEFIEGFIYNGKGINDIFNRDFKKAGCFQKVKDKILYLQQTIADTSQNYSLKRNQKVEELNHYYEELIKKSVDIEQQIKELNTWTSKTKQELLDFDKKHYEKMNELNNKLKYYLSIEELNKNQEDITKYIEELISLVKFDLIDTISLEEIERVREFQSNKNTKEKKLIKKL